jgi:DNA-binding transcriptional LysR family regulator
MRNWNAKTMRNRQYDLPPLDQLEAFEAAARHLSFTRAADELALTQSAVSRQVAALEAFFGVPLFQRLHRALRLSAEGQLLQRTVVEVLQQLHQTSSSLRGAARLKTVVVTTTAGFAGLWLIPRLAGFTSPRPDVDVRISASNAVVNLNRDGVDVAIRYHTAEGAGDEGVRLFGEVVLPVCSPKLRRDAARPLKQPEDLRYHCLLHMDGLPGTHLLEWPPWLRAMKLEGLKPASVLHFSMYDQMIQAAVNGQGVALGRLPLLNGLIAQRKLVTPFNKSVVSPRSYYLFQSDASRRKPEVREFLSWLLAEAAATS